MPRDYDYWYKRIQDGYDITLSSKHRESAREVIDRVGGPDAHPPDITTALKQYFLPQFADESPMVREILGIKEAQEKAETKRWLSKK